MKIAVVKSFPPCGTLGGAETVNIGGILDGVGTLVLPGLTLAADAVLKFEFNTTLGDDFDQVTGAMASRSAAAKIFRTAHSARIGIPQGLDACVCERG